MKSLKGGVGLIALMALGHSGILHAQETNPDKAEVGSGGDIVVTARKVDERLLDVPVAVTALSGDFVKDQGARNISDLAQFVPGFNFSTDHSLRAYTSFRGIGGLGGATPGVGLFIDGVYQPNQGFFSTPLLDVERVEFLKGPQGALYGRNTLGGVINIITAPPPKSFEMRVEGSVATNNTYTISGMAGAPLAEGLSLRIAGAHSQSDGFVTNVTRHDDAARKNSEMVRATLAWEAAHNLDIDLAGYLTHHDDDANPYVPTTGPADVHYDATTNTPAFTRFQTYGVNLKARWRPAEGHELTLVAAYDRLDPSDEQYDTDYTPNSVRVYNLSRASDTYSLDLKYRWDVSDQLEFLAGAYYADDAARQSTRLLSNGTQTQNALGETTIRNLAAYASLTYRPLENLELVGALRYDSNRNGLVNTNYLAASGPNNPARFSASEHVWQPKFSVTYHWTPDVMTYLSVAKGYRGGGFNTNPALTPQQQAFSPEITWNYEAGVKASIIDRRVTANLSVYRVDDSNAQESNVVLTGSGPVTATLNLGSLRVQGVEFELTARPIDALKINLGMSLSDFNVASGANLLRTDKRKFNFGMRYDQPLSNGNTIYAGVDGSIAGPRWLSCCDRQDSRTLVNAQIGIKTETGLEFAVFAKNLFNEKYFYEYADRSLLGTAYDIGVPADKRLVGVRVSYQIK